MICGISDTYFKNKAKQGKVMKYCFISYLCVRIYSIERIDPNLEIKAVN